MTALAAFVQHAALGTILGLLMIIIVAGGRP